MTLKDKNENRLEFEFDTKIVLNFTGKYDTIHLDLGNNFTDTHFIKALAECYEFEQLYQYLTHLEFDTIMEFTFVGNYGNVGANYYLPELFDLLENHI
tara:strand:+ start:1131 stop:1424 length:294 start_codon:yes stop_codon:yes gene_type:complete